MKKLLLLSFMLCFIIASFSQVWIDHGAEWHYHQRYGFLDNDFIKISYVDDTTIDGKVCQKLHPERHWFAYEPMGMAYYGEVQLPDEFTYQNGDTVFHYFDGSFYMLYNFGAQPGDSWPIPDTLTGGPGCTGSAVTVNSIGTMMINGQSYRWIFLMATPGSGKTIDGRVVERFGPLESYLFPKFINCDTTIIADYEWFDLYCFQDDSFALYNPKPKSCEYQFSLLGNPSIPGAAEFNVWPNPASDKISVNTHIQYIDVYNVQGAIVERGNVNGSGSYNVQHLPAGYYILKLTTDQNKEAYQKLVKR